MTDDLFSGPAADLEAVLAARDARVARRQSVIDISRRPLISLSIVMPGPVKDCAASRYLRQTALDVLMPALARRGWTADIADIHDSVAGAEAIVAVTAPSNELKLATVEIEDTHPLGRLWDLDVIDPETGAVSRRSLGLPARRCLVCSEPAHACARSRAHPIEELLTAIKTVIDAYRRGADV
jgi:holo-ACP synthase